MFLKLPNISKITYKYSLCYMSPVGGGGKGCNLVSGHGTNEVPARVAQWRERWTLELTGAVCGIPVPAASVLAICS